MSAVENKVMWQVRREEEQSRLERARQLRAYNSITRPAQTREAGKTRGLPSLRRQADPPGCSES